MQDVLLRLITISSTVDKIIANAAMQDKIMTTIMTARSDDCPVEPVYEYDNDSIIIINIIA